ncbi:MAG: 30S ribosomal protein S20 [candidate division WWE3 bacterium]|nr:30S ribosomal protein S20 [candidate division WWE3 bacterium]
MANLKSAQKKTRVDIRRTKYAVSWKTKLRKAVKLGVVSDIYKVADKMAKNHIIHPNKAARIKGHAASKQLKSKSN